MNSPHPVRLPSEPSAEALEAFWRVYSGEESSTMDALRAAYAVDEAALRVPAQEAPTGPWYAIFNEVPGFWSVRHPDRAIESGQAVGPLENAVEAIAVRDALNSVAASSAGKEP